MNIENLLLKAEDNHKTGKWAEDNRLFDVAISRYYYSLFEKILFISKKRGFYSEPDSGNNSHNHILRKFKKEVSSDLEEEDITWLASLTLLKDRRVYADYKEERIENTNDFNLSFKAYYNCILDIVNRLL